MIKNPISKLLGHMHLIEPGTSTKAEAKAVKYPGVRDAIDGNTAPALAPSTLAARRRRGNFSARTLVDTGKMRLAIKVDTKPGASAEWPDDGDMVD